MRAPAATRGRGGCEVVVPFLGGWPHGAARTKCVYDLGDRVVELAGFGHGSNFDVASVVLLGIFSWIEDDSTNRMPEDVVDNAGAVLPEEGQFNFSREPLHSQISGVRAE